MFLYIKNIKKIICLKDSKLNFVKRDKNSTNKKILLCASLNIPFELNIQNIFFFFKKKKAFE